MFSIEISRVKIIQSANWYIINRFIFSGITIVFEFASARNRFGLTFSFVFFFFAFLQAIMQGHADGEMWGLSTHPSKDIFVTTSDDMSVRTWDINTKVWKVIKFEGKSSQ